MRKERLRFDKGLLLRITHNSFLCVLCDLRGEFRR